jgi:hypothetical protein
LSGHGLIGTAEQVAEKLAVLKKHDFSRVINASKATQLQPLRDVFRAFCSKFILFPQPVNP